VVWCKPRTPPKVPAEESLPAESRSALPDKATVDAITSAEAEVGRMREAISLPTGAPSLSHGPDSFRHLERH
jgi:hypothetical protein